MPSPRRLRETGRLGMRKHGSRAILVVTGAKQSILVVTGGKQSEADYCSLSVRIQD